nr:hypothetical protein BgiMline_004985 [Biomphalaria glabrata]
MELKHLEPLSKNTKSFRPFLQTKLRNSVGIRGPDTIENRDLNRRTNRRLAEEGKMAADCLHTHKPISQHSLDRHSHKTYRIKIEKSNWEKTSRWEAG